jgi:hypothetical protein
MIKEPKYFFDKGYGTLSNNKFKTDVEFELFLISGEVVIYCKTKKLSPFVFVNSDNLTLSGFTEENKKIQANNLLAPLITNDFIELVPNPFVFIGDYFDNFYDQISFPITNLFDVRLDLNFNGFDINIKPHGEKIQERISRYWKIPQVGTIIKLTKKTEVITNYEVTINSIILLLSLAKGRHISFAVMKQYQKDKQLTVLGNKFCSNNYIHEIVPTSYLSDFLMNGTKVLTSWSNDEILDFKTVLEYLNDTDTGYLDDRVFRIMQCWEIVANRWSNASKKLPTELNGLKQSLRRILKSWHTEFTNYDVEKFWDNRILGSLKWQKNITTLEDTLARYCIDNSKLKVDFKKLVDYRNAVAHSGRLGKEKPIVELITAQFSLRLVLLRLLDYDNKVLDYRFSNEDYIKPIDIKVFLTS